MVWKPAGIGRGTSITYPSGEQGRHNKRLKWIAHCRRRSVMKSRKMTINNTYKEHHVFKQLSEYADFYKSLAFSIFRFTTQGTKAICNMDSYVYSSIQGTLESIKDILIKGRIKRYEIAVTITSTTIFTRLYS